MATVMKNQGKTVRAWRLGDSSEMEQKLITNGKIVKNEYGYELFSQESKSGKGELAKKGDYFKVDNAGYPYPNAKDWFEENHKHISGDSYEQLPKPLTAWEATEEMIPEIKFLVDTKRLVIDPLYDSLYFGAHLWGSWLNAAKDAVIVIYGVQLNEGGEIFDVDFNFVARSEFEKTYHYVD